MKRPFPSGATIRLSQPADLPAIFSIYERARRYMAESGNPSQWGKNRPPEASVRQDVATQCSYVCEIAGSIEAVFMLQSGEDPTYGYIDGAWIGASPYHTIHRIAASGNYSGTFDFCVAWCYEKVGHLRIDTHDDNKIMQHLILKNGFTRCGIINQPDGTTRIAYEKL